MRILAALLLGALLTIGVAPQADAVSTQAAGAIVMDVESGRVLYAQDLHTPRPIASITKLMTALVVAEQVADLSQMVQVKGEWLGSEGSSIYLKAGESITVEGLLYGLLLQSGNDAAKVLACYVAESEEKFAALMNEKAAILGMEHTAFANASGLTQEGHYSTPYDMALLARACLDHPRVAEICATRVITVGERTFVNHNKLLSLYPDCIGMKTGYTEAAGRTLVSAAQREGQTLVCVTLDDPDDWTDHTALYDHCFETYPQVELCQEGEVLGQGAVSGSLVPIVQGAAAEGCYYPLAEREYPEMVCQFDLPLSATIPSGTPVGTVYWYLDGEEIASTQLVAAKVIAGNIWEPFSLMEWMRGLLGRG